MPLPQPISAGSISHGRPERSTNRMPVSAARLSIGGRPPFGRGRGGGRSGGHLRPEIVGKQSASHAPPTHHPPLRAVLLGALNFFSRSRRRSPQTAFASQPIDLDLIPPGTLRKRPVASEVLGRDDGVSGTRSGHAASMICRRRTILEKAWIDRTSSRLGPSCCGLGHSSDIEHRPHCQHGHRSFALGAKPRYTGCNRYGAAKMGNDQSQR